jgi:hypothetical protein
MALTVKLELKTAMLFTQIWHTKMQKICQAVTGARDLT